MSMMLINARPRFAPKGFGALVPTQRVEFLHQRLVDMTNNETNAWGLFRPVATSTDHWDQHLDDFGNENFPFHTLYAGYYQEANSTPQSQGHSTNQPKAFSYAGAHHNQCQTYKKPTASHQPYEVPAAEMNSFGNPSLMLGNDYSQWDIGRRNGSFAEFSSTQSGQKNSSYQAPNDVDLTSFASAISLARPQSPYQNNPAVGVDDVPKITRSSLNTVYSSYSSTTSVDPQSLAYLVPNAHEDSTKNTWWPEHSQGNKDQYHGVYGMVVSHDGLPRAYNQQQQQQEWNESWHLGNGLANNWTSKPAVPITVSPKALTLNVPPAPLSSCGSSQGALSLSDSNAGFNSGDDHSDFSGPETLSVVEPPPPVRRPRHILPDSTPVSQRSVPVLPSNGVVASKSPKKRPLKPKPGSSNGEKSRSLYSSTPSDTKTFTSRDVERTPPPKVHKRIEPKLVAPGIRQPSTESQRTQLVSAAPSLDHRDAKDDFLVRSKLAGMSYKDIRRQGNFTEAESTLRGRFRTLTKHKAARVRKPEWAENDIRLLKRAVRKLAQGSDASKSRVPWKQVADYIANNGGSYHFGNATCRKRWDELQMTGS